MKHFISYFCTLAIALSMALQASASEPYFDSDGISYAVLSIDDRTVTVTAYTGDNEAVSIPQQVTYEGTTYTVARIGDHAFSHCIGLTSVTIPNSVTEIGLQPFFGCLNLTDIIVDPENSSYCSIDGVLYDKKVSILINCPEGKKGSLTIPGSVTTIGIGTFAYCTKLATIYCEILEPFFCDPQFHVEVIEDAILYVPTGCKTKYETIAPWNNFKHIEEKTFSDVDNIPDDRARILVSDGSLTVEGCEFITVYDINGRIVYRGIGQEVRLAPGIYLVKERNSCVKVVI